MKNKTHLMFLSLSFLYIAIIFSSCDDVGPEYVPYDGYPKQLTPFTTEGKGVLGCKVNGSLWESYVPINLSGDIAFQMGYDSTDGHFGLNTWWTTKDRHKDEKVGLEAKINPKVLGKYSILNSNSAVYINYVPSRKPFYVDTTITNELNLLFYNKEKKIISGTFYFTAITADKKDTVRITEGRFDGKY